MASVWKYVTIVCYGDKQREAEDKGGPDTPVMAPASEILGNLRSLPSWGQPLPQAEWINGCGHQVQRPPIVQDLSEISQLPSCLGQGSGHLAVQRTGQGTEEGLRASCVLVLCGPCSHLRELLSSGRFAVWKLETGRESGECTGLGMSVEERMGPHRARVKGQGSSPHFWARTQTELSGDSKESYLHSESYPATPFHLYNTGLSHTLFLLAQMGLIAAVNHPGTTTQGQGPALLPLAQHVRCPLNMQPASQSRRVFTLSPHSLDAP